MDMTTVVFITGTLSGFVGAVIGQEVGRRQGVKEQRELELWVRENTPDKVPAVSPLVGRMIELYEGGLSLAAVARRTGFSDTKVRNELLAAGVKMRRRGAYRKGKK
jgi:hypothetical protein